MRAAVLMSLRVPGQGTDKYDNVRIGMNARLDIIQAAVPSLPKSVNQIRSPTTAADYRHASRGLASAEGQNIGPQLMPSTLPQSG